MKEDLKEIIESAHSAFQNALANNSDEFSEEERAFLSVISHNLRQYNEFSSEQEKSSNKSDLLYKYLTEIFPFDVREKFPMHRPDVLYIFAWAADLRQENGQKKLGEIKWINPRFEDYLNTHCRNGMEKVTGKNVYEFFKDLIVNEEETQTVSFFDQLNNWVNDISQVKNDSGTNETVFIDEKTAKNHVIKGIRTEKITGIRLNTDDDKPKPKEEWFELIVVLHLDEENKNCIALQGLLIPVDNRRHTYLESISFAKRSAISQVMARNMSHNHGSHVLSRMVHPDQINNLFEENEEIVRNILLKKSTFM